MFALDGAEENVYNENTGCSYYNDDETGLYYLNARYYSPLWRRFISPDDSAYLTHESINGLNLYCYCNNDPINYVDPSGHSAKKFYLFGYEWRKSAGWKSAPTIIAGPVGRIGFSSYVTRKKKRSGVLYGFAGATSDVTSFLDTTYYAGVGVNLFGILGAEVQLETFGIGAMVSIGDFSISLSVNLLASTSITFAVDTDLGDDCTQTTGFTVGINTVGLLIAAAYAYFLIINGLAVPSPVPSPAL